jgi:hypothetical protein
MAIDPVIYPWPGLLWGPEEFDLWVEHPTQETIGEDSEVGLTETLSGFSRCRVVVTWNVTTPAQALAIEAHLNRLRGQRNGTQLPILKYTAKIGTATGAWSVNGFHRADAERLHLTGTGAFAPGDWLQITQTAGTPRAYQVLSYASGIAMIAPALHDNVTSGAIVAHLGDGVTTVISDTMELVSKVGPATAFPASGYALVNKRSAAFVSFRRATAAVAVVETVTNNGVVVTNGGVAVTATF